MALAATGRRSAPGTCGSQSDMGLGERSEWRFIAWRKTFRPSAVRADQPDRLVRERVPSETRHSHLYQ
jgi:hypothetical protein